MDHRLPIRNREQGDSGAEEQVGRLRSQAGSVLLTGSPRPRVILVVAAFLLSVLLNRGGATFERRDIATADYPAFVAVADLNGDGKLDLVVACQSVCVFLGNGDGTFEPRADYADSIYTSCLAIGDVNGDGRL